LVASIRVSEIEIRRIAESHASEVGATVYARVSSSSQRDNLERHVNYLLDYYASKGYRVVGFNWHSIQVEDG